MALRTTRHTFKVVAGKLEACGLAVLQGHTAAGHILVEELHDDAGEALGGLAEGDSGCQATVCSLLYQCFRGLTTAFVVHHGEKVSLHRQQKDVNNSVKPLAERAVSVELRSAFEQHKGAVGC